MGKRNNWKELAFAGLSVLENTAYITQGEKGLKQNRLDFEIRRGDFLSFLISERPIG